MDELAILKLPPSTLIRIFYVRKNFHGIRRKRQDEKKKEDAIVLTVLHVPLNPRL